jgi:hypothetical protein
VNTIINDDLAARPEWAKVPDLGRQWKLGRHLILENFQENEPESAHVASIRVATAGFLKKAESTSAGKHSTNT